MCLALFVLEWRRTTRRGLGLSRRRRLPGGPSTKGSSGVCWKWVGWRLLLLLPPPAHWILLVVVVVLIRVTDHGGKVISPRQSSPSWSTNGLHGFPLCNQLAIKGGSSYSRCCRVASLFFFEISTAMLPLQLIRERERDKKKETLHATANERERSRGSLLQPQNVVQVLFFVVRKL